ncbi:MAG: response regulator [Ruminococcus sp.]|nr:response regulator [Ruminococcus sp.]
MKKSKLNLTLPLITTFILMVLVVIYTSALFYRISVSNIYEVGSDKISGISASLGNYLDTNRSVLWVTADTVDFMVNDKRSNKTIWDYLILETQRYKSQFDQNYTGLYGYISGEYLDGLEWVPPDDYDPTEREWYQLAEQENGLVIVPPYIDAQTGEMVISFCKHLSDRRNVVAIDMYTTHIQEIIESTSLNGKGYGFIVDKNGTVIAHSDHTLNGINFSEVKGGDDLLQKLESSGTGRFESDIDGRRCTVFTDSILDQWHLVIVVGNDELFSDVYSQLVINIITNMLVFILIALFYFFAYRKEEKSRREAEALKISEQQKAYEAEILRLEKAAADSANKAKGDFLAQMSHEIRTPINAVLGMNEMILRESDDENILDYSRNIRTAGKTLLSLINSILDFSKIEDGKMEIIPARYETASMISNLVNTVSERAKGKGLELEVNADPKLPCELIGDDVRVMQVIVNLLTNAVKYTEKGKVTLDIRCAERTDDEAVLAVSVSDTGIGIRKEDMEKLFESFSRLEVTRNRHIEGTGLGMAIVTKLLALMDSKLNVESTYGEGSVFSFEIRQGIADKAPMGDLEHRADPEDLKSVSYPQYPGARVLVTDDNDMNLKVAANLLKLFGIRPELAASGEKTVELMCSNTYDIVFLDHMMPKMDGIETLGKLNESGLIPEGTAMIALTANAVLGAKESYLKAGFDDYLSKPIGLGELSGKLEKYLPVSAKADIAGGENEVIEFLPEDDEVMEFLPDSGDAPVSGKSFDAAALEEAGIAAGSGLNYCAGDKDFYLEMLADYAGSCEKRMSELEEALRTEDMKQYGILVHALKSVSATVGADDVSVLARSLEEACKKGDAEYVSAHHAELGELFRSKAEAIERVLK